MSCDEHAVNFMTIKRAEVCSPVNGSREMVGMGERLSLSLTLNICEHLPPSRTSEDTGKSEEAEESAETW